MMNGGGAGLPPIIHMNDPQAYDIWVLWRATDRRFLPSQLLNEPAALLQDMLTLDGIYERMQEQRKESK